MGAPAPAGDARRRRRRRSCSTVAPLRRRSRRASSRPGHGRDPRDLGGVADDLVRRDGGAAAGARARDPARTRRSRASRPSSASTAPTRRSTAAGSRSTSSRSRSATRARPRSSAGSSRSSRRSQGITLFMQPVQDLTVEDRVSRTQYQYSLEDPDAARARRLGAAASSRSSRRCPSCATSRATSRTRACRPASSSTATTASRLGITPQMLDDALYDAFGQRQISTMFTQLNQYRVVLEVAARLPDAARTTCSTIYLRSAGGGSVPLGAFTRRPARAARRSRSTTRGSSRSSRSRSTSRRGRRSARRSARSSGRRRDLGLPASIQASFQGTAQAFRASLDERRRS